MDAAADSNLDLAREELRNGFVLLAVAYPVGFYAGWMKYGQNLGVSTAVLTWSVLAGVSWLLSFQALCSDALSLPVARTGYPPVVARVSACGLCAGLGFVNAALALGWCLLVLQTPGPIVALTEGPVVVAALVAALSKVLWSRRLRRVRGAA